MSDDDRGRYERVDQAIFEVLIGEFPDASINDQTFAASAIRARLAEDGLLVEPGSETREEWNTTETVKDGGGPTADEDRARQWLQVDLHRWKKDSKLIHRTVHTGPWREVPDGH